MIVDLDDIRVMYVKADGGLGGAADAFRRLESRLESLTGRKFYGIYQGGEYRACVEARADDEPSRLGLSPWTIPGGRYARRKMVGWQERIPEIGKTFDSMSHDYSPDLARPSVEFYRSSRELILFLPVK
jgi:DNA gyrase inhibitor GyrI